jgi:hypothetical protein
MSTNTTTDSLSKLLGKDAEEVSLSSFSKQYKSVVDAVKKAGNGDVKVFKIELDHSRSEYFVVSVDREGNVVGMKALSVES